MNGKLKEMMKKNPQEKSEAEQMEFFEEFTKSSLILPVTDQWKAIQLIEKNEDKYIVPFFTDETEMERFPELEKYSSVAIRPEHAKPMISELDRISEIVIDPGSPHSVAMTLETFNEVFRKSFIDELEEIIRKEGRTLPEETRFYLRENGPMMKEESENGIFTSEVPFQASFRDEFKDGGNCLNILIVSKGTLFLPLPNEGNGWDTLFAPVIRFQLIEENGNIYTWKSISQELKHDDKNYKPIYLIIAIIIIVLIVIFINLI